MPFALYPAYWLVIVIAIFLHSVYIPESMSTLSDWAKSLWVDKITPEIIGSHATLILKTNTHAINPVVWSLITEMRMSLILPIFIYLLNRAENFFGVFALISGLIILVAQTDSLMFFPHFALGACLAKYYIYFNRFFSGISHGLALCLSFIIFCLYGNRWVLELELLPIWQSYLTAVASGLLIVTITTNRRLSIIFQSKFFYFLGKTSYSFYLLHLPILLVAVALIYPFTDSLSLPVGGALIVSYSLASIFYRFVEKPAIRIGKLVSEKG